MKKPASSAEHGSKKAVLTVLSMVFAMVLSKGLGMIRSVCMASAYGTGWEANAFSAASRIPLSFFDLLFSAAILGCFIPVYNSFSANTENREQAERDADRFASVFLNFILLLTGLLAVIGILFAKPIISVVASGLAPQTAALAADLLRILFPMILFTGSAYTLVGILQSKEHFLLPSFISAVSNLGVILFFIFSEGRLGENRIYGLAVAYLFSWLLQLLTLVIPLVRLHFPYKPVLDFRNPALRKALKMTPPIMIGSWLAPIGMLAGTHFASQLSVSGAVTVFEYSTNIDTILTGILTYGICNFLFPKLSRLSVSGEAETFAKTARTGILASLAVVLPVMGAVLVLADEGTALLYLRGAFTAEDTAETANALRYLALGMPAFCLTEMISRILYAQTSVYVPMTASLCGAAVNVASTKLFLMTCAERLRVGAVTLGSTLGQTACALILMIAVIRLVRGFWNREFVISLLKLLFLTVVSSVLMFLIAKLWNNDVAVSGFWGNLLTCGIVFVPGGCLYLVGLRLSAVRFQ